MKIKSDNFVTSLKNNNSYKIVLLHGPNFGLVNLLYNKTIDVLSIDLNDPFSVSKVDGNDFKENPTILNDSISTFSMGKDKRIVLLDLTYITINKTIENIILNTIKENNSDYLLLIKANNLGSKNDLVKFIENLDYGFLVPCYEENSNNVKIDISRLFNKYGFNFSTDFISILSTKFNPDTLINLTELKKLESFLIDNENITEESVLKLITDNIDLNFNKIIQLCTSGKIKESLFYLDKIYENSSSAINITRLFMKHFKIIEKILLKVENGSNLSETINDARPPIFFKDRPLLTTQCRLWSLKKINLIFKRLIEIELKCKSSIYPDKILISQFILSTSLMAKNSART